MSSSWFSISGPLFPLNVGSWPSKIYAKDLTWSSKSRTCSTYPLAASSYRLPEELRCDRLTWRVMRELLAVTPEFTLALPLPCLWLLSRRLPLSALPFTPLKPNCIWPRQIYCKFWHRCRTKPSISFKKESSSYNFYPFSRRKRRRVAAIIFRHSRIQVSPAFTLSCSACILYATFPLNIAFMSILLLHRWIISLETMRSSRLNCYRL